MGRRGSAKQRAAPFFTFAEADQLGILEKGRELLTEGGSRNEGGGKLPLLECKVYDKVSEVSMVFYLCVVSVHSGRLRTRASLDSAEV